MPFKNPFRPGNGIEPPYLAGREEQISTFQHMLKEVTEGLPLNLVLYGLRGTGKTVLLGSFRTIAEHKGWLTVEREFNERYLDDNVFAEAIAKDVTSKASGSSIWKKFKEKGKGVAEYIKPEEFGISEIRYKPYYGKGKELLEDYLEDVLINNWSVFAKSKYKGLIFLYDEFHVMRDDKSRKFFSLSSFLSALAHAQKKGCRYVLVVSGLPNLTINLKESKTYVERMFRFSEGTNLTEEHTRKAITVPLKSASIAFENDLVERIIAETHGYPYFIQFYCYHIIDNVRKRRITLKDFEQIRNVLLKQLDISFFKDRFERTSDQQQKILTTVAKVGNQDIMLRDIKRKLTKMDPNTLNVQLNDLVAKGLLYRPRRGHYSFTLPLFRDFILRRN